jgi:major vault protein
MDKTRLIKIPPFHYLHVLNKNSNITTLVQGPKTYICKEHEQVTFGPAGRSNKYH